MKGTKRLRDLVAAALTAAALLATHTASAVIDLDKGTGVEVAKETLLDTATTMPSGTTTKYYKLLEGSPEGKYDFEVEQGIAFGGDSKVFLRIELINMVFGEDLNTDADCGSIASVCEHESGGTTGAKSVVFSIGGSATAKDSDTLTIDVPSLSVLPDAAGSVKVTWYREALDASLGINAFKTVMADDVVEVVDGLEEKGTSSGSKSDVASGFSMFDGTDTTAAQIGHLRIRAADNVEHRAGTAVRGPGSFLGATDGVPAIEVIFKGDFANHTFKVHPAETCTGTALSAKLDKAKNEYAVELSNASTITDSGPAKVVMLALCMEVDEKNTKPIPDTDYTASVKYTKLADAMFPRADQTVTIGSIGRTGTTVHIPYLTTYMGYNQRIVLSNRSSAEAGYTITFRPEAGITATAGDAAEGMLAANSTMTLKAADVVTLEGGSRTAATIAVVADPKRIDVTSVIVNRESRDTDTVVHHSMM